jgi:hypothetical protein
MPQAESDKLLQEQVLGHWRAQEHLLVIDQDCPLA